VVTASKRRLKPIGVQPGDCEWITLIAGINAMGWSIPPFFILKAKHHNEAWYHNNPLDWRIGVSKNGWTTNELGLAWLQHFIQHTKARTVGSHQLLIIDSHKSHQSLEFQKLYEESKIITLCMPLHASHILQPLDVGCFAPPLKQAYKKEIRGQASHSLDRNVELLAADLRQIRLWGEANKVTFAPEKQEMIYLTRQRGIYAPPCIVDEQLTIKAISPGRENTKPAL
jgi:hypothetical protein